MSGFRVYQDFARFPLTFRSVKIRFALMLGCKDVEIFVFGLRLIAAINDFSNNSAPGANGENDDRLRER